MTIQHMVDLETLSTDPKAIVLSIGVVAFDTHAWEVTDRFYSVIERGTQEMRGRTRSDSTVAWWGSQSKAAIDAAFPAETKLFDTQAALVELARFMAGAQGVWGNGASFDNVILASLFSDYGVEKPWQFWHDRCFRTLKSIGTTHNVAKPAFQGEPHNALDDAIHQFQHLREIVKALHLDIG